MYTNATGYHPGKISALTSRNIRKKKLIDETKPESTGTQPQHLESTSNAVTHQSRLESTSNVFSTCRKPNLLADGVWSPPATPRFHEQGPEQFPTPGGKRVQPYEPSHTRHGVDTVAAALSTSSGHGQIMRSGSPSSDASR